MRVILGFLLIAIAARAACNFFVIPVERHPATNEASKECRVFYLLNIDGMKGLGHSALLLQDEEGSAQIFSYNGMQYGLLECLAGKSGVGKMVRIALDTENLEQFWSTGDLLTDALGECDNFDRAIYRDITREQYDEILSHIQYYIEVGDEFERLYADAPEQLREFVKRDDIPRYQIYTHNCDAVAREIMATVDREIQEYNQRFHALTPGGNYRKMCRQLGEEWGVMCLGEDSLIESCQITRGAGKIAKIIWT